MQRTPRQTIWPRPTPPPVRPTPIHLHAKKTQNILKPRTFYFFFTKKVSFGFIRGDVFWYFFMSAFGEKRYGGQGGRMGRGGRGDGGNGVRAAYADRVAGGGRGRFFPQKRRLEDDDDQTFAFADAENLLSTEKAAIQGEGRKRGRVDVTWPVRQMFSLLKRVIYSQYLRPGCSVLDLGHGPGTDLPKFAHAKIGSLIAVDFVQEELDEAAFRAKTNPRFRRYVRDVQFVQQDLCRAVCRCDPPVDVVTCQFALHYFWGTNQSIHTIMTSIRDSLRSKGHFIATVVDASKIPTNGIPDHPFIHISPPTASASQTNPDTNQPSNASVDVKTAVTAGEMGGRMCYRFSFAGLVKEVEEFVIPSEELIAKCREFSLQLVATFTVREQLEQIRALRTAQPDLSSPDWQAIDLYRCYVFQKA